MVWRVASQAWFGCANRLVRVGGYVLLFTFAVASPAWAAEAFFCKPKFPVFCRNVHMACAGRVSLVAPEVSVHVDGDVASLVLDADGEQMTIEGNARQAADLLITFPDKPGYFRIDSNGRYSYRLYRGSDALMSVGQCQPS